MQPFEGTAPGDPYSRLNTLGLEVVPKRSTALTATASGEPDTVTARCPLEQIATVLQRDPNRACTEYLDAAGTLDQRTTVPPLSRPALTAGLEGSALLDHGIGGTRAG